MKTQYLYHYCKISTAIELILPQKQLLLNTLVKTNDPRENKSFVFKGVSSDITDISQLEKKNSQISDILRSDCKITCFSGDEAPFFGYEHSRLWALYGDNHKGICLKINKQKFLDENEHIIRQGRFGAIKYYKLNVGEPLRHLEIDHDKVRFLGEDRYLKQEFRNQNIENLFFTKNIEWESEHEYRVVYFSNSKDFEYCKIENSLDRVYVGIDFNTNYLPSISNKCPVDIYQMDFKDVRLVEGNKLH